MGRVASDSGSATRKVVITQKKNVTFTDKVADDEDADVRLVQTLSAYELKEIATISLEEQELIDLQHAMKLSRQRPAPTIGYFGLSDYVGMSGLNSQDEGSRKEKQDSESFNPDQLINEPTMVDLSDVNTTKLNEDNTNEYNWFNRMMDAHKDLKDDETPLEGSTVVFNKSLKKCLKIDKLTNHDLKRIKRDGFALLQSRFKSITKFECSLEQVVLVMDGDIDYEGFSQTLI
nr:hypothetical protein [Tanacetum cinerariifolium]